MRNLKKEMSLAMAIFYGVGIILGAGIYVLIGQGAAIAGNGMWISFILAGIIAAFTGLSYAELAGMFPRDAAEYVYTNKAFKKNSLSFLVEWVMIFALIISTATVALGFGGYFSQIFRIPPVIAAAFLIIILGFVNYKGIKLSVRFNLVSTLIEVAGLLIVIAIGSMFIGTSGQDFFDVKCGATGIISATALIFFAYIGFEELVNLSEETKNAKKAIPRALVISLAISTLLYILVSVSAIAVVGSSALAASSAPLSTVVATVIPQGTLMMSVIALFATANTALAMMIAGSRMIYGLSRSRALPRRFVKIGKSNTPYAAVFAVMLLSLAFLFLGGIKTIASLADAGIFIVYIFINFALIWLRYKKPSVRRTFRSPVSIGRFPVLALFGILSSLLLIFHFDISVLEYEIIVIAAGIAVSCGYSTFCKRKKSPRRP